MDGHLCVDSREGEGTSVHFALYFKLSSDAVISKNFPRPPASAPTALRILLAEDDPSNAFPTQERLKLAGHHVTLAENGRQVLKLLKDQISPRATRSGAPTDPTVNREPLNLAPPTFPSSP